MDLLCEGGDGDVMREMHCIAFCLITFISLVFLVACCCDETSCDEYCDCCEYNNIVYGDDDGDRDDYQ